MTSLDDAGDEHRKASQDRERHIRAILESDAKSKVVVAGPGTGKTFLFKKILYGKPNSLTLTFVNSLVEDLSLELCQLSDVRTLHGYARSILGRDVKVFPKLSAVIKDDAKLLLTKEVEFDQLFHDREDDNELITFYKCRKDYYDNYYGYSSLVYAAVKKLEQRRHRVPAYDQVLVDEFQDFNKLEVSLIDLLAEKSPILLAGDDDQALYGFKGASPSHIRKRHNDPETHYQPFCLPYCSRCTQVIVDSVNDIIAEASKQEKLRGRIAKPFLYFSDGNKDQVSASNPKIAASSVHARQLPWFIEKCIHEAAAKEKSTFNVLVIAPTKRQCQGLLISLRNRGFKYIESHEQTESKQVDLIDGLRVLLEDGRSNLGWRVVAKHLLPSTEFQGLLERTAGDAPPRFEKLLCAAIKGSVRSMIKTLRAIQKKQAVEEHQLDGLLEKMGVDTLTMKTDFLSSQVAPSSYRKGNPALRKIPIKITTIQSSKGLTADYVFFTHFDDKYLIKDSKHISDEEICNLLVAMTRARTKVFLISTSKTEQPTFLSWIKPCRVEMLS